MSIFGWSYPPGAATDPSAPYNQIDEPCGVCGQWESECVCPECPTCGAIGDPLCYDGGVDCSWCGRMPPNHGRGLSASWCGAEHNGLAHTRTPISSHGLVRSPNQIIERARAEEQWRAEAIEWEPEPEEKCEMEVF